MDKAKLQSQLERCEDEEERRRLEREIKEYDERIERLKQRLEEIAARNKREEGDNSFIRQFNMCEMVVMARV